MPYPKSLSFWDNQLFDKVSEPLWLGGLEFDPRSPHMPYSKNLSFWDNQLFDNGSVELK
jgi:hypothetical protein